MTSRGVALVVMGVLLLLAGTVFSLQGADVITGSQLMSGNATYIYVGAVVALVGILLMALAYKTGRAPTPKPGTPMS